MFVNHHSNSSRAGGAESPRREVRPDSTIPDSDLAYVKPLPTTNVKQQQLLQPPRPQFNASLRETEFSNSPQRISLDERLEKELGIKIEAVPPPAATATPLATGLPATIPTYDNTPMEPSQPQVPVEKEQAIAAAQMVTTKLMEMQAAKEAERQKKREQRMAERMALMSGEQVAQPKLDSNGGELQQQQQQRAATGRILEQVELQEQASEEQKTKKKKKEENGTPTLITLKPFYRPHEKRGRKRKLETPPLEDWEEYSDVPRSPVPLPDNSTCKPVLVKLGFGVSKEKRKGKNVKYKDGMAPGQGSPDHSTERTPTPPISQGKKYKKVKLIIIRDKDDENSQTAPPPPPPPGSPPRYSSRELIARYGQANLLQATA